MYVQSHHVPEAAGEEHGIGTFMRHFCRIALDQTYALEIGGYGLGHFQMDLLESDSGPDGIHSGHVSVKGHVIYHSLLLRKCLLTGAVEERSPA